MSEVNIASSEVHVWHADQADFELLNLRAHCISWLTDAELERYRRYQFERHRKQFLLGRVLIRFALSYYDQSIAPEAWRFSQNEYGKPAIHPEQQSKSLYFNLSHSGGRLVLALANFTDIGIDIEHSVKPRKIEAIAARYFSSTEAKALAGLAQEQQQSRFYQLWTLKEAYIKACGMGLAIPLRHFSYSFPTARKLAIEFAAQRDDDENLWQFWQLAAGDEYQLSMAARAGAKGARHKILSWQMTALGSVLAKETTILRTV